MISRVFMGIAIPFIGTFLGAAFVLFIKKNPPRELFFLLCGGAAGVMTAASVWSLLLPAIDYSVHLGSLRFIPAVLGFCFGVIFMLLVEKCVLRLEDLSALEGKLERKNLISFLAVTLHNFPEGLAVGMTFVAAMKHEELLGAAFALSVGIALQNIPEGAIISMPLYFSGVSKGRSLFLGAVSGIAEPVAALCALLFSGITESILPYFMGFAAGAMLFVVMNNLSEEMKSKTSSMGFISYAFGFCLMMSLDVALG